MNDPTPEIRDLIEKLRDLGRLAEERDDSEIEEIDPAKASTAEELNVCLIALGSVGHDELLTAFDQLVAVTNRAIALLKSTEPCAQDVQRLSHPRDSAVTVRIRLAAMAANERINSMTLSFPLVVRADVQGHQVGISLKHRHPGRQHAHIKETFYLSIPSDYDTSTMPGLTRVILESISRANLMRHVGREVF